jgi:hypothetical protein
VRVGNGSWRIKQAVWNNSRRAIFFGEVVKRPNGGNLDVHVGREREHIETPLIAMQSLGLTAWSDIDDLGEMKLERVGMGSENFLGDV